MRDGNGEGTGMPLLPPCLPACLWATHLGPGVHRTLESSGERSQAGVSLPPRGAAVIVLGCSVGIWIFQNSPGDCNVWPGLKTTTLRGKQI